jgi:hypothetical protein
MTGIIMMETYERCRAGWRDGSRVVVSADKVTHKDLLPIYDQPRVLGANLIERDLRAAAIRSATSHVAPIFS